MNIAVIFAGGVGRRMNAKDKPKQFLTVHGKPIIVHTIEIFQNCSDIDGIAVACVEDWIPYMEQLKAEYNLTKIGVITKGGQTGQLSIYNALKAAADTYGIDDNIVLIHDGVRPLIDEKTIQDNIEAVKQFGSAITCGPAIESVVLTEDGKEISSVAPRDNSRVAKAPESFFLKDILEAEEDSISRGITNEIDSCALMAHHGMTMHIVEGNTRNLKITTPEDFYMFKAIYDSRENSQLE
ncbi:MAG: 2-C-methyl-D-erythritol 4-phosphate cytidylyltransferase [Saccharofermentans sp.]|nr:2-C-methyl-D-erythritol 4-phosphate cytidylyltransferase [Saccharofermentans sp.]